MPSIRQERVAARIMAELSSLVRDLSDPRIETFTITKVDVSPDLRQAKVYFSMLKTEYVDSTLEGLNNAAGHLRTRLAKVLQMRTVPVLHFFYDRSQEHAFEIAKLIEQALNSGTSKNATQPDNSNTSLENID